MNFKEWYSRLTFWILVLIVITQIACNSRNQNHWSQFRGEGATGVAPENATPPNDFSADTNVLWKIETPNGFSSPCVFNDNLILTGVNREAKKYLIWNINCNDGSVKWKKEILVDTLEDVHPVSSPAAATPVSDGENIYCYFPPKGLTCLDYEGNYIWESAIEFEQVLQGSGTSPIVYKDKVILNHDNLNDPKLMVFNKANGELVWESSFDKFTFLTSSWSTPAIWNSQIIIHRINSIETCLQIIRQHGRGSVRNLGETHAIVLGQIDHLFTHAS